jgi:hypothetical protein
VGGGGLDVTGSLGVLSPTFPFITALSSSREPCVFFLGGTAPWLPDLGKGSTDRWDLGAAGLGFLLSHLHLVQVSQAKLMSTCRASLSKLR